MQASRGCGAASFSFDLRLFPALGLNSGIPPVVLQGHRAVLGASIVSGLELSMPSATGGHKSIACETHLSQVIARVAARPILSCCMWAG